MVIPLRDNAPTYDFPIMNLSIIGVCILVWFWQLAHPAGLEAAIGLLGEVPAKIYAGENIPGTNFPRWIGMFTAVFGHANWGHILGNMYFLWLFGDNIEWVMGRWRYLGFYLLCGLLAAVATVVLGPQSDLPGIGASGAIAGVLGAYWVLYPRARITSIMWISPFSMLHWATGDWGLVTRNICAVWFMGSWVVFEILMSGFMLGQGVWLNLGVYAHAAGALAGLALAIPFALKDRRPGPGHYTRSDAITMPIIGDAGAAGEGVEPVNTLGKEVARLHGKASRKPLPSTPFSDYVAQELIEKLQLDEAERHCLDMLKISRRQGNQKRTLGYEQLIRKIRDQRMEIITSRKTGFQQMKGTGRGLPPQKSYKQKLEDTKRRLRGESPDWLK